jgi:hypothetical protein
MAKHDQRILKFLNQNADRAPTITEMMTRLNISISDISDSLGSLAAQGLIAKKTNNQGIECWFPNGSGVPQMAAATQQLPVQAQPQHLAPTLTDRHMATMNAPMASERSPGEVRSGMDVRYQNGAPERGSQERMMQAPEPQPPMPKQPPVQVQHIPMAEPVYQAPSRSEIPPQPAPMMMGGAPMYGLSQPAKGVGFFTLLLGLAAAVGVSTFLATKQVQKASKNFVDRKALTDATASFTDFQEKTKTHVTALETEVKRLTDELALSKASAESLKVAATAKPEAGKPGAAKADAGKTAAAAAKAEKAEKAETAKAEPVAAKGKAAAKKALPVAKAVKPASNAIAKAAARGAAKRKKSMGSHSSSDADSYSSGSSESGSSSSSSSSSEPTPSVPDAPGLENQDLPPPPAE